MNNPGKLEELTREIVNEIERDYGEKGIVLIIFQALWRVEREAFERGKAEGLAERQKDYDDMRRFQAKFMHVDHELRELKESLKPGDPAPTSPKAALPSEERIYPCQKCGKLRTKDEGGTTFTVCDDCWDKHTNTKAVEPAGWPSEEECEIIMSKLAMPMLRDMVSRTKAFNWLIEYHRWLKSQTVVPRVEPETEANLKVRSSDFYQWSKVGEEPMLKDACQKSYEKGFRDAEARLLGSKEG